MTNRITADRRFSRADDICVITFDPLGKGYEAHSHDFVEIVLATCGHATHVIDSRGYQVAAGDIYVIQGDTTHGFVDATSDFEVCNVMYRPDAMSFPYNRLRAMPGYQALFVIEPARRRGGDFASRLRLDAEGLRGALDRIHRVDDELRRREEGFDCAVQAGLLDLTIFLSRQYSGGDERGGIGVLRLGETVAWMEKHFTMPITVGALAEQAGMSERNFLRIYRQTFRTSPIGRLIELRVRRAAELLHGGGVNVAEAAQASGFNDSNYFTRQFRKVMGLTPKRYAMRPSGR